MDRNIAKMRKEGSHITSDNSGYDLTYNDLCTIYEMDDLFDIIRTAYLVGLASGCRYGTRKERKKHLQNAAKAN